MRRLPLLLLILAPLVALWPGLTGLAVGPFDQIRQMAPWNGPKPAQPWDVLMVDSVLQSHVWRTMVLDAWGKGQLPLWNPYEFAGTPLLANSQSGGFYPPHIVLGLLHVPAGLAGFLLAWFHLALAGVGTYALVRRLGGSPAGGLTGGLAFALSPFLLGWTPLSSVPATVAWVPLALASVAAGDRRSLLALSACVGMMLLAGHLQFAAYGLGAVVLFGLASPLLVFPWGEGGAYGGIDREENEEGLGVEQVGELGGHDSRETIATRGRGLLTVLLAVALGAALAAPQLLPVLAYSKESHRRNSPTEDGYQAYLGSALRPFELANLGHPMALGSPRDPVEVGGTTVSAYWPALVKPGANFAESAVSVGAVVFALLFAVPWRRRETWALGALGLLALLLALGTPLNRLFYFLVPGWSSTGSPARVEVIFLLAACALAGLAVDGIAERSNQIRVAVGAVVGMMLALVMPNLASADGAATQLRGIATTSAMIPVILATAGTVLAIFVAKRTLWAVPAGVVAVACLTHALNLVPFGATLKLSKGNPNVRIAVVNDAWDLLTAAPAVLPPNLAALSGLHELGGYDSLTSRDAVEMLRTVNGGQDPAPPANGNMMFVKPTLDPKALAECGVTEIWSRKPLPQLGTPEAREGYLAYRIAGPGRVTGGKVVDGYDRQEVIAEGSPAEHRRHSVIVRDRLAEGWGTSMSSSSRVVPFGSSRWREFQTDDYGTMVYSPPGLWKGIGIGDVAWLALIGLSIGTWRKITLR